MIRGAAAVLAAGVALAHLAASPVAAFILDGQITAGAPGGAFVKLQAGKGTIVGADTFDSPDLYAFDEDQNITLPIDIEVDIPPNAAPIPKGTVVAAHYVFFDPDAFGETQQGYVDFDSPVLGIATGRDTLANTDFLADTEVIYLNPTLRGLEARDAVWIDPENPFRVRMAWWASSPGDYIRVFTAKSPGV